MDNSTTKMRELFLKLTKKFLNQEVQKSTKQLIMSQVDKVPLEDIEQCCQVLSKILNILEIKITEEEMQKKIQEIEINVNSN